jgi:phosphoheptose isomerase
MTSTVAISSQDRAFLDDYYRRLAAVARQDEEHIANICATRDLWLKARDAGGRVVLIGNGGSAGIASHLAIDLAKNAKIPAFCFNDASLLTCLANDFGYEKVFASAVRLLSLPGDCLVAISSSGRSANILNGVAEARAKGLSVVTLSGMTADTPLRRLGDVNFWSDSRAYNIVETAHQFWLMSVIDLIIGKAEYPAS